MTSNKTWCGERTLADRPQVRWEAKDILELVQVYQQGGSVHNV